MDAPHVYDIDPASVRPLIQVCGSLDYRKLEKHGISLRRYEYLFERTASATIDPDRILPRPFAHSVASQVESSPRRPPETAQDRSLERRRNFRARSTTTVSKLQHSRLTRKQPVRDDVLIGQVRRGPAVDTA